MARVNFVAEFGAVIRYCFENGLPVRERMLLIALFYVANSRAIPVPPENENASIQYEWPEDFFTVSNAELNLYAGLEKRAIIEARNSLCQRGIIEVRAGQRRAKVPEYKLSYFSIRYNNVPKSTPKAHQNHPKDTPKAPQNHPKDTPKAPQNHPLNININQTMDSYMGDNQSISRSISAADSMELDRLIDRLELDVFRNCTETDKDVVKSIEATIRTMYTADSIKVNGQNIPQAAVRDSLSLLETSDIDSILYSLRNNVDVDEPVINGKAYLISCIYNAPFNRAVNNKRQW